MLFVSGKQFQPLTTFLARERKVFKVFHLDSVIFMQV